MLYLPYQVDFLYDYDIPDECESGEICYSYNYFDREWSTDKPLFYEEGYVFNRKKHEFRFVPTSPAETAAELFWYLKKDCWDNNHKPEEIFDKERSMMYFEGYLYHQNRSVQRVFWRTGPVHPEKYNTCDWNPIMEKRCFENESERYFGNGVVEPEAEIVLKDEEIGAYKRYTIYCLEREDDNNITFEYDLMYLSDRCDLISRVKARLFSYDAYGNDTGFCGTVKPTLICFNGERTGKSALMKGSISSLVYASLPVPFNKIDLWEWKKRYPWFLNRVLQTIQRSRNVWT